MFIEFINNNLDSCLIKVTLMKKLATAAQIAALVSALIALAGFSLEIRKYHVQCHSYWFSHISWMKTYIHPDIYSK